MSRHRSFRSVAVASIAGIALALLGSAPVRAATLTWTGTAGSGGSGTWNTTLPLWNLGAATWSNAAPDNAVFTGSPGTITLGTALTAGSVTFNSSGYALNAAANLTASTLAGSGGVSWIGTGTLTLSGSSTLTGRLSIGDGLVQLNNGASLRNVSGITISGGAGTVGGTGYPFRGAIRGGALYLRDDVGTGGGNQLTTTGTVAMQNGTILWVSGAGSDFTTISNVNLDSGFNTIAVGSSGAPDVLTITNLTRANGATVEFRAAYAAMGTGEIQIRPTNINGSPIANSNGILGGWAFVAAATSATEFGGPARSFAAWNPSATIGSAVGSIVAATPDKANGGSGATTNSQDIATGVSTENWLINTSASGNTISSGTVVVNSLIAEQVLRINNGSTLVLQSGGLIFRNSNFSMQTSAGATGFLTSGGNDLYLQADGGAGDQRIRVIITDGTAGAVTLRKSGPGTVAMDQKHTFTGGTVINQGVINLDGGGGQTGAIRGTATINAGGTLRLSTGDATGWGGGSAALTTININGGTLDINTTGNQTLGSGTLNLTGGSITGTAGSNIDFFGGGSRLNSLASAVTSTISGVQLSPLRQGNTTFDVAAGTTPSGVDLRIDSVIKPAGAGDAAAGVLTKSGAGWLLLTATNTFARGISIAGGTLELGGSGVLGSGSFAQTIANSASFVFSSSAAQTLSGAISGSGLLRKTGAGSLTLSGANTYSGGTIIQQATLGIYADGSLGDVSGAVLLDGGTLNSGQDTTFVEVAAARPILVAAGKTGGLDATTSGTLRYDGGIAEQNPAGAVSNMRFGSGGRNGTVILGGSSSYRGTTTVNEGTLKLAAGASLASSPRIAVNAGATFNVADLTGGLVLASGQTLSGYGTVAGDVVVGAGAFVSPGGSIGTLTNAGTETWAPGGTYIFEVTNAKGTTPGTDWDFLDLQTLLITATSTPGSQFTIQLRSLTSGTDQTAGPMNLSNWDQDTSYAWMFVHADNPITAFDDAWFVLDTNGFLNDTNGTFQIARGDQSGIGGTSSQLYIVYAAVPEPGALALAAVGLVAAAWAVRRHRATPRARCRKVAA